MKITSKLLYFKNHKMISIYYFRDSYLNLCTVHDSYAQPDCLLFMLETFAECVNALFCLTGTRYGKYVSLILEISRLYLKKMQCHDLSYSRNRP